MTLDRRHVIHGALAGLTSWLLVTHLVPSLRWVPYAFVAGSFATLGVILLASLRRVRPRSNDDPCFDDPAVVPAFVTSRLWEKETAALDKRAAYRSIPIWPNSLHVSARFDDLLQALLDDHVSAWFAKISPRPLFRNEIDRAVRSALTSLVEIASGVDLVEAFILRLVPIFTGHMQAFYVAERLVRGKNLTRDVTQSDELDLAVATKYRDGNTHKAVSLASAGTAHPQQAHVRKSIDSILPKILPATMRSSPAVMTLVREILSCAVLTPILALLEDPDTWNQLLETFARTLLQDRKSVKKLRAALDEHAPRSPRSARPASLPVLRTNDSERQFERFIRALRSIANISDARRFRNELAGHLTKQTTADDNDLIFTRRLQTGKKILDQRIETLTKEAKGPSRLSSNGPGGDGSLLLSRLRMAPLRDVLHNPSGLSYFMEFMDRQNKMRLVQFWITIDGFRNPLEDDNEESEFTLQEKATYVSADRLDIAQIKLAYLDGPGIELPHADQVTLDNYMSVGIETDMQMYLSARRVILRAQTAAYEDMRDNDFDEFKCSDLFYKWLAVEESIRTPSTLTNEIPPQLYTPTAAMQSGNDNTRPHRVADRPGRGRNAVLRRAAASSVDLSSGTSKVRVDTEPRRSVDDMETRPLFNDDVEDGRMAQSTQSLASVNFNAGSTVNMEASAGVVDVMQKELGNIMNQAGGDANSPELFSKATSPLQSLLFSDDADQRHTAATSRPNLTSLGLIGGRSFSGVFADDLFADEQEKYLEDEKDVPSDLDPPQVEIKEAAPGDLGLSEAVHALKTQLDRLVLHDRIIDSLTKKAELTNNAAELRILRKSKQSLQREIERAEMQKQQYIIQESDNSLYGKASVAIKSIMVGREEDGHEYAIYVIEVRRQAGDTIPAVTWSVTRRYSEFHELHKRLRAKYSSVRTLEFPRRQTLFSLQKEFLRKRRILLESYLQELLRFPVICRSRELRAFLSQSVISSASPLRDKASQGDFVTRIYNSITDGMDELLGNIPALDQLTVAGHNLISAAHNQLNVGTGAGLQHNSTTSASLAGTDPASATEAEAEIEAFEDRDATPFVKPISDLFVETFELQKGSSWLRGRALVVVLHQLLGGTVERKIRETARVLTAEPALLDHLARIKESLRPGGEPRQSAARPRSAADKAQSRKEASLVLATLVPDMASGVVGKANAQAASRKISAMLNNERLNTHLVLTLFDEIVSIFFPDAAGGTPR